MRGPRDGKIGMDCGKAGARGARAWRAWRFALIACGCLIAVSMGYAAAGSDSSGTPAPFEAGFARREITPPIGTPMTGFGGRDRDAGGARGVHDPLYCRALYLRQAGGEALILALDIGFLSRDEVDRYRGALGRHFNLPPASVMLNASNTHTGPKMGRWFYTRRDELYQDELEARIIEAVAEARANATEAVIECGETSTSLPISRRKPNRATGEMEFLPNPAGVTDAGLPVVMMRNRAGKPIVLLYSVGAHPSNIKGDDRAYQISADFPGAACRRLDEALGTTCSMFLQGAGGSAKCSIVYDQRAGDWKAGDWDDVERAGELVAREVLDCVAGGMKRIDAELACAETEIRLPLAPLPDRKALGEILENATAHAESLAEVRQLWAREQIDKLDRHFARGEDVGITLQGIKLGNGLRAIGIEGIPVAELGLRIRDHYGRGTTLRLGHTNGAQMYLPSSAMLEEGGYEIESYWEFRQPAPPAPGIEERLERGLEILTEAGID